MMMMIMIMVEVVGGNVATYQTAAYNTNARNVLHVISENLLKQPRADVFKEGKKAQDS